ncbi:hypothetical protein TNIN_80081 [Trichonephila inaurata madagascariensis]|uniref:Reverse transcriptase n=1 Tax=Trichonephila inaurata madagascariensis TaxID=2747483 RepID=A0A8X6WPF4_9ARAC|nr:hypothetical protein TNIN_80081 [Trichonephila inaurata madagascariensis]
MPILKRQSEFLGHVVWKMELLQIPSAKTQAVRKFPRTNNHKNKSRVFLAPTGYFRKYIKDYSAIAKPLSDLTRKIPVLGLTTKQHLKLKILCPRPTLAYIWKYMEEQATRTK